MSKNENFIWVDLSVNSNLPVKGEYIVKTISYYGKMFDRTPGLKKENVLMASISYNEKGEHSWTCKNQIVTHYLKEINL